MNRNIFILFSIFAVSFLSAVEPADPLDRLVIRDGAVLTGRIQAVEGDSVRVQTDYAGEILVDTAHIESIELGITRDVNFPEGMVVLSKKELEGPLPEVHPVPVPPEPIVPSEPEAPPERKAPAEPQPPPPELAGWSHDAGLNITGKHGNTERFDLTVTIDSELERTFDRTNLYGRYTYGKNQQIRSANEIILGGRYTNFFINGTGAFLREELEHDEFEGIDLRSTTAAGLTYKVKDKDTLNIEARTGMSYRYEEFTEGGDEEIPGMDLGLDINWRFVRWARFKGAYTYVPAVDNFDQFIFEQDSGVNLPLDKASLWNLRFGIVSQYNNLPDAGREKLDLRYYARLITSWD